MITYHKLKIEPHLFSQVTAVSVQEFDRLYQSLYPAWVEVRRQRLKHRRRRAVGAGRKHTLKLREQLLMTLIRLHLKPRIKTLEELFGVNRSTVSRNINHILPVLYQSQSTASWPEPPTHNEGKSAAQVLREFPGLADIVA
jgi:hypothetical protein